MKSHMFCADGFQNPVMHGAEGCRVEHFSGFRGWEHIGIIRVLFVFFHQNLHGGLRKCQQSQGVFRFWLADNKLMVDAADAFGDGKRSVLHIQIFPEQGQQFSPAQPAGQFQIERCKHTALLRFVQIWPDQFFRQHFHFFSYRFRGFAVCCRIAQNELFCDGLIETFPQDSEDTLHNAWAERRFFQRNVAVVVISAVLAHLVDRALNLNGTQLFQWAVKLTANFIQAGDAILLQPALLCSFRFPKFCRTFFVSAIDFCLQGSLQCTSRRDNVSIIFQVERLRQFGIRIFSNLWQLRTRKALCLASLQGIFD